MFSLARALTSPISAEVCPSLFDRFTGTTARSNSSGACQPAVRLLAFSGRSRSRLGREVPEVSRFSCMLFLSVRGFLDYAEPAGRSRSYAASCVAFPLGGRVSVSDPSFSKLNSPAHRFPCLRFNGALADAAARLRVKRESLLLSCRALSSPTTCRFIPAHPRHGFELSFTVWETPSDGLLGHGGSPIQCGDLARRSPMLRLLRTSAGLVP